MFWRFPVTQVLVLISLLAPMAMAKQDAACAAKVVACQMKCTAEWDKVKEDCDKKCGVIADCNTRTKDKFAVALLQTKASCSRN